MFNVHDWLIQATNLSTNPEENYKPGMIKKSPT